MSLFDELIKLYKQEPDKDLLKKELEVVIKCIKECAMRQARFQYQASSKKMADAVVEFLKSEGVAADLREDGLIVYEWVW